MRAPGQGDPTSRFCPNSVCNTEPTSQPSEALCLMSSVSQPDSCFEHVGASYSCKLRINCKAAWHRTGTFCALVAGMLTVAWTVSSCVGVCVVVCLVVQPGHCDCMRVARDCVICTLGQVHFGCVCPTQAGGVEVLVSLESMSWKFWREDLRLMENFFVEPSWVEAGQ